VYVCVIAQAELSAKLDKQALTQQAAFLLQQIPILELVWIEVYCKICRFQIVSVIQITEGCAKQRDYTTNLNLPRTTHHELNGQQGVVTITHPIFSAIKFLNYAALRNPFEGLIWHYAHCTAHQSTPMQVMTAAR